MLIDIIMSFCSGRTCLFWRNLKHKKGIYLADWMEAKRERTGEGNLRKESPFQKTPTISSEWVGVSNSVLSKDNFICCKNESAQN